MSQLDHVPISPPDPILNLNKLFNEDKNPKKVSLGVGAYRDENGKPWILPSVRAAEDIISKDLVKYNKEYPPQPGFAPFLKAAQEFLLGEEHEALKNNRVATCQSLSGTGSLHVGFCMIKKFLPEVDVYIPDVTWPNHMALFKKVFDGIKDYKTYQYLQPGQLKIDFETTKKQFMNAKDKSVFILHACAHNPTGIDFTKDQWVDIAEIFKKKSHIAFFDIAYQGFATGSFEDDGYSVRMFAEKKVECMVAQSFSKNFGLYGERVGACHIIHNGKPETTVNAQGAMCIIVRETWSMSPIHGAYIVQTIGTDPALKKQFLQDVQTMADRIKKMRQMLFDELKALKTPGEWGHILSCIGMFTFTGLTSDQVDFMTKKYGIYLVKTGGRMSMCGLTEMNVKYVAEAMNDAVTTHPKK